MLSGKMLIGLTLGAFGASVYYKARNGYGRHGMSMQDSGLDRLVKDVSDLKEQMTSVRTAVDKPT
jgi:hypothetical protein